MVGHVVDTSNGRRRFCAGGRVNADGGVMMVAALLTQVVLVIIVVQVVVVAFAADGRVVAGGCVVNAGRQCCVLVGSVDIDGRVAVAALSTQAEGSWSWSCPST